ncbi:hypothetical protein PGTUg99_017415 [Puccinia graminis f. sp. tritici]|uniref:Uncharacterized protein n=1 Tax=Puccinia graminis f. sp. tritici TaxID=56615 RepID=A0A5B0M5X8_PUCGR|nr:hypothetical protein PGTUg99_017415 [Puccinia graminis f. sp. tritici]
MKPPDVAPRGSDMQLSVVWSTWIKPAHPWTTPLFSYLDYLSCVRISTTFEGSSMRFIPLLALSGLIGLVHSSSPWSGFSSSETIRYPRTLLPESDTTHCSLCAAKPRPNGYEHVKWTRKGPELEDWGHGRRINCPKPSGQQCTNHRALGKKCPIIP